ncbi:MAG: FlgD immunoglobulin-like domain containing protein, partial [Calditrichia bacterium]
DEDIVLPAGHYWISVSANTELSHKQWGWKPSNGPYYSEAVWINPSNGFGTGFTTWTPITTVWQGTSETDLSFLLFGINGIPASNPDPAEGELAVELDKDISWTNPGNAVSIEVFWGTHPDSLISIYSGSPITTIDQGQMNYATDYYWRIDVNDGDGVATGKTWHFSTIQDPSIALNEDFDSWYFPPDGWVIENTGDPIWEKAWGTSAFGVGAHSLRSHFFSNYPPDSIGILITHTFNPLSEGDSLRFDHAYAPDYGGNDDQLEISYSTDGGQNWQTLVILHGGFNGELVTAPQTLLEFFPNPDQWGTLKFAVPGGTNKFKFRAIDGHGNDLYLDNIKIEHSEVAGMMQNIAQDWNLMSPPGEVAEPYYLSVYPSAIPNTMFGWNGSYILEDSLKAGAGFWLRFPSAETVHIDADTMQSLSLNLLAEWNLIGGPSCNLAVSAISDPGAVLIPGTVYGFNGSYFPADTLMQGHSYWIRSSAAGQISLSCGGTENNRLARAQNSLPDLTASPAIRISDAAGNSQTLYLNVNMDAAQKLSFSLPPLPPSGAFDARFTGNFRALQTDRGVIEIQSSNYPVSIKLLNARAGEQYFLREKRAGNELPVHPLKADIAEQIADPAVTEIEIYTEKTVPADFALEQNYPNPFNPETRIRYSLPQQQRVELTIYNALGQQVRNLESGLKSAGSHTAVWDGTDNSGNKVSSGIYIYRLKSGEFESRHKMILMK